jgi:NAD(P)-dependent dehydrogenase (short-subunit alcohol dehydrogenase family)
LRDLRVPGPEVKYQMPSSWAKPTGVRCGEPSGLIVVSHGVCRFGPPVSGACVISEVSVSRTRSHSIGVGAYSATKFALEGWSEALARRSSGSASGC